MIDHLKSNGQASNMHPNWLGRLTSKTRWDMVAMFLGLIIMNFAGFGSRNVFESTAAICTGIAVFISVQEKMLPAVLGTLGLALIGVLFPSIYRLHGYWGLLLSISPSTLPFAVFPACCWSLEYFSLPPSVLLGAPLVITLAVTFFNNRTLMTLLTVLFLALSAITISEVFSPQPKFTVEESSTFAHGYKIGAALKRVFPNSFGTGTAIRSNLHGTQLSTSDPGIVIAEHDTPVEQQAGRIKSGNFTQPAPWSMNEFFGNQYWLYAIRQDGALVSNLGAQLTHNGRLMLGIPWPNPFSPTILASNNGMTLYCSDSDYWVNRLCNYQQNLLGVIISDKERSSPPKIANIAFAFIAIGSLWIPWAALLGFLVPLCLMVGGANQQGDIRLIGPINNPHDPTRAWAVARRLQDEGVNAIFGNNQTKTMVVAEGYSGRVNSEVLVIAEPRAKVLVGSHKILVLEEPQGLVDTIPDARKLLIDGQSAGVKAVVDGVTVVGTGSPALTPSELWHTLREQ